MWWWWWWSGICDGGVEQGVNIDDGGGPENIEPADSSVESGEVDNGKGSSTFTRAKESAPCARPGVGSVNSASGEKPDDSGSDGYMVWLAVPYTDRSSWAFCTACTSVSL